MKKLYRIYAPPGFWGPKEEIARLIGQNTYKVSFDTISQAPSTFEVEIEYWQGSIFKKDVVMEWDQGSTVSQWVIVLA